MATVVNKVVKYSGGDYTTLADAITAFNARDLVSNDEQWNILLDESASGNTQWTITSELSISNANVDATRYLCIKANTGKSFKDNASKLSNALRYNASNGVGLYDNGSFRFSVTVGAAYTRFEGLQFYINNVDMNGTIQANAANLLFKDCVFEVASGASVINSIYGGNSSDVTTATNCVFIGHRPINVRPMLLTLRNCTFVRQSASSTGSYVALHAGTGTVRMLNSAAFGYAEIMSGGNNLLNTSDYNATDLTAPTNWGSNSLASRTTSNEIESATSGSIDARAKTGSTLGAGTRDATNTSDLDIVGTSRSTSTPTIGAWELAGAPSAPSGITSSSVSYTSASISWTDNSSDETGFKVRYAPSPYSSWTTATGSVAASPYLVTGLSDGTSYKAGVAAFNATGDSTWVESGVFTTSTLSKLRPNTDTSAGSWAASSGSVLYSMVDEVSADDTDYITSTSATTCKLKFETSTDPADNSNHRINIRARSSSGTLTVKLVQGDPAETTIVSWAPTLTSSFANYQYDLSTAEASVITDYSALYLKLTTS